MAIISVFRRFFKIVFLKKNNSKMLGRIAIFLMLSLLCPSMYGTRAGRQLLKPVKVDDSSTASPQISVPNIPVYPSPNPQHVEPTPHADDKPKTSLTFEMKLNASNNGYSFLIDDAKKRHQFEVAVNNKQFVAPQTGILPACAKLQNNMLEFDITVNAKQRCALQCSASGEVSFNGLLMREKLDITVPAFHVKNEQLLVSNHVIIAVSSSLINEGTIASFHDCKISSNDAVVFKLLENARINCDKLDIDLPKGCIQLISGTIFVKDDISITANNLSLSRLPVVKGSVPCHPISISFPGGSFLNMRVGMPQLSYEVSNPAAIMSRQGNVTLAVGTISNEKGTIYAQKNMNLSFRTLTNVAGRPEQRRYLSRSGYTLDSRFYDISFDTENICAPDDKPHVCYTAALIWCGNTLQMTIDGKKYQIRRSYYRDGLPGVVNTGLIGSSGMLDLDGGNKPAYLANGLISSHMPIAWGAAAFGDLLPDSIFQLTRNDNPLFLKTDLLHKTEQTSYKPSDFPIYLNHEPSKEKELKSLVHVNKFFMSPSMEVESSYISIGERTGHMLLPDEQSCLAQLEDLKQEGILFGQINGNLMPKASNIPTAASEEAASQQLWNKFTDQEKQVFESTAQLYRVDDSRSGFHLFHNKRLHPTGNYWIIITDFNKNRKPKVSFFYQQYPHNIDNPSYLVPAIYIAEKDYSNFHPEAMIKADEAHIHGKELHVFNTGSIVTAKTLKIEAKSFVNEKLMQEKKQTVKEGLSGERTYSIRVPQEGDTGVVLGLDIDIKTDQDTVNKGGKISATHNVKLVSKHGDVINTYVLSESVIEWDPGFWGKVLGKQNSSKVATFVEGKIEAGNDVELLAEAGLAMNLASTIEAGGNATIDGFLGVLTQNCAYKYLAEDSTKFTGLLTIKSVMREAANVGMSRIIAKYGDVTMQSKAGKVTNIGTSVDAGGNIHYKGGKGNVIKPFTVQTKWRESTFSIDVDGIMHEDTKGTNTDQMSGQHKAGKTISMVTTENNDVEFEDFLAGERIIFKAGKKNNIKGVTRCYETDTTQTSLRVNAFGIPILKALFNDGFAASLQQFAASDPLVASLMATVSSERLAQAGYRGVFTAAEFIRLIDHLTSNGTHAKSLKALIAKRLGFLSSDEKSFSPTLNLRLGQLNQKQAVCMTTQPTVDAQGVEINSGEESNCEGLKFVNTKEIIIKTGGDLSFTPGNAVSTETSSTDVGASISYVPGVGITGAGIDATMANGSSEQHPHVPMRAKKTEIIVGGNMKALNYVFGGEIATDDPQVQDKRSEVKITVINKDCLIGTLPDKSYYEQYHAAIFAGLDGQSGSASAGATTNEKVAVIAQGGVASGTKIGIKVTGKLTLNGALIDGEGDIEADELEANDIHLKDNAISNEFSISYQSSSAVNSQESFTRDKVKKEGIIHTVIGPKINLRIAKGIPANLRRNINEAREDFKPEESHLAFAFFTPNFERLREIGNEWRQMRDDTKNRARALRKEKEQAEQEIDKFFDAHEEEAIKEQISEQQEKQKASSDKAENKQSGAQKTHKTREHKAKEQVIEDILTAADVSKSKEMNAKFNFGFDAQEQIQFDFGSTLDVNAQNTDPNNFKFSTGLSSVTKSGKVEFSLKNNLGHEIRGAANIDSLKATAIKIDNIQRGLPLEAVPVNPALVTVDWALGKMITLVNDWGGIAGACIGGTCGAALGAVGGTIVPGAGTLGGAVGGGLAGARYGALVGNALATVLMGIRVGLGYDVVNHRALSGQERLQEGLLVTATAGLFYGARKSATYLKDFKIFGYVSDLCYRVKGGVISFVDKTKQTVVTSASAINKTFANFMEKQFGKCAAREGFIAPLGNGAKNTPPNFVRKAFDEIAQKYDLKYVNNDLWESRGGLAYGPDKKFGNRVNHVLAHTVPDTTGKASHTIFNVHPDEIINLIDEAWLKRGASVPGDPYAYIVEMGRIVGKNGETSIKVAIKPNTINHIATAYPVK